MCAILHGAISFRMAQKSFIQLSENFDLITNDWSNRKSNKSTPMHTHTDTKLRLKPFASRFTLSNENKLIRWEIKLKCNDNSSFSINFRINEFDSKRLWKLIVLVVAYSLRLDVAMDISFASQFSSSTFENFFRRQNPANKCRATHFSQSFFFISMKFMNCVFSFCYFLARNQTN